MPANTINTNNSSHLTKDVINYEWHTLPEIEVVQTLVSHSEAGLSHQEATKRHQQMGANQLNIQARKSPWLKFIEQFHQPLLYILIAAGVVTLLLRDWIDAGVIFSVTLINVIISYIQESKAEDAIAALSQAVTTEATVIRDGQKTRLASTELVVGDLVLLASGDKVPADLRLLTVRELQVDESALTGESVPVEKTTASLAVDTPLAERNNMAYAGSFVSFGQAEGMVVAIADATETGRISQLIESSTGLKTPLTRNIDKLSKTLLYAILGLAALTFAVGLGQGESWIDVFKAAVALVVSAIPEGLPAIVTVILSIGVSRMARRNAIIRKLPAVETLGSTTVICSDKTGTLTENQMTVQQIYAGEQHYTVSGIGYAPDGEILLNRQPVDVYTEGQIALGETLAAGLLCNDSHIEWKDEQWSLVGTPTEGALITAANKAGLTPEELPRIDTIPFESQFQYMATLHKLDNQQRQNVIYVKGSVEAILQRCDRQLDAQGQQTALNPALIEQEVAQMAKQGLRVLAFASKKVAGQRSLERHDIDTGLVFLGLQGIIDPPREEAIAAVAACQSAGIQVKMITGDHALTAGAIARQMEICSAEAQVFTGKQLAQMDEAEFSQAAEQGRVFARVAPEQKLRLVKALQHQGEIVAMTGDGVNDAPALKQADIGVAMGLAGAEVAKESADMLLTDDNFAAIEAAVEEGRGVYRNLRKAIAFLLPINIGESMTILIAIFLAIALPILPIQILWLNMVSSVGLIVPLAFEPKSRRVMQQPPRNPRERLLSGSLLQRILAISLFNWLVIFGVFQWILQTTDNEALARTMAINGLVAAEVFYLLSISQFVPSVIAKIQGKRKPIAYAPVIGIVVVVTLQCLFSQWSIMNQIFGTTPLTFTQALICVAVGLPVILIALILQRFDPLD
ncbi:MULTISPECIES: cation-translocating P-type ATPase [unclassified Tolypothrix]|uniref:cation-translocating P-type ATPase n=1 Tax=unclassified Tolypothrix TaxID=2649714 RepID=UPI0005EAB1C4|nr:MULTISPECIES: HAD-IC family P-type ATPase [unclassified Tolypothrix]BAY92656.1 ATPase, E1-E2 type [Microchaete diplosiphon NIES-3275]EKF05754.1 putative calcium-translocating P-type ATPase, PMCA-type [Tolypothrix sp. PCC 7601]MBE9083971.1 HAD-IC family P-type ATPase [Tolypothrix sp. LEGE 11397]UYD26597.1 HAD-IC family P-type ATPase [Tolypothrix sp. PCC 7712]UYD31167.1 HAD-IC family P-type ATPase [Tolypothrix sp. PCC 7601]